MLLFLNSDVTALAKDRVYTHINISEITIHEVLIFVYLSTFHSLEHVHCVNLYLLIENNSSNF